MTTTLPKSKYKLAVIIVNYNGGEVFERCLKSLANQELKPNLIYIFDNASQDFNEYQIEKILGEQCTKLLMVHRSSVNLGYSCGLNRALEQVLSASHPPDWILTLNNDTELESKFFLNLNISLNELENLNSIGMLSPKVLSMSNRNFLDATGLGLSLDGMSTARGQRELDQGQYDQLTDILMPNGVAALYKSDLLQQVGFMDESFWAYCEDTDLGLRAWLAGWNCRFLPQCIVYHARSTSHGEHSLSKLYYAERNHYWVVLKNLPLSLIFLNPIFTVYRYLVQIYAVLTSKGQGRGYGESYSTFSLVATSVRAMKDALLGLPQALQKRKLQRHLWRRSRGEILRTLWKKRLRFSDLILK